jgi:hypothetical protein
LERQLLSDGNSDRVPEESQRSRSGNRGIELPETAGSSIARICKQRIAGPRAGFVHLLEALERKVNLAANLDWPFGRALVEAQRNVVNRPQIHRYILADGAIAARRALDENAIHIRERDRGPIDLELRRVSRFGDVVARHLHQALLPGAQLFVVERVGEREHRPHVLVLGELALNLGAYAEGWRIRASGFRKVSLEIL